MPGGRSRSRPTVLGSASRSWLVRQSAMRKRISIALGIVTLVIVGVALVGPAPPSRIPITGDLPAKDVARILRLVRAEVRRDSDILPDLSWDCVRDLPSALRRYRSERIYSIDVLTNGKVWVRTVSDSSESYGSDYYLRRGHDGWQITESYDWMPSGIMTVEPTVLPNEARCTE